MNSQSGQQNIRFYLLILTIFGVCLLAGCGRRTLATADNEFDANRMLDILYSSGFEVEKEENLVGEIRTWDIIIDEGWFGGGEFAVANQVLLDYGLPRPPELRPKEAGGFGMPTEREEKERQTRELQIQVERQLYTLPDVIRANVIIAQPTNSIMSLEKTPPTASVALILKETEPKFTTENVQALVSGAVPNLKMSNVNVAFSKQPLREVPIKELRNQRRRNEIFAIAATVILLLAAALGAVWYITKRRKRRLHAEPGQLTGGENSDEFADAEPLALNTANDE